MIEFFGHFEEWVVLKSCKIDAPGIAESFWSLSPSVASVTSVGSAAATLSLHKQVSIELKFEVVSA